MEFKSEIIKQDTYEIINSKYVDWNDFRNKTILITGATGLIGTQIVLAFLLANKELGLNTRIIAHARNKEKCENIFKNNKTKYLEYLIQDINTPIKYNKKVDFIIHTANSTSSKSFVETPVETIDTIILGTKNILEFAKSKQIKSLVYLSSMEVYGKVDIERKEPLKESDYGYIDVMAVRSSYSEGKRLAENMCIAYSQEYGVPVKIARLSQTIGSGVDYNDNRVFAQFARNIVENKDIELLTEGKTIRSYCYITDAVSGIFAMLERGKNGECYNVANPNTTCSIREMAEMLCNKYKGSKLKIEVDNKYFPPDTKMYLDTTKMYLDTTWIAKVSLEEMFDRLIENLKEKNKQNFLKQMNKNTTFLQKIFSVKNKDNFKIYRIFGLKFSINMCKNFDKYKSLSIKNNKIVFSNTKGNLGYGCNPKYIAEELLKQKLPYELVWLVNTKLKNIDLNNFPKNIKIVNYRNKNALKELATAKIWIDNQWKLYHCKKGLTKKDGQYYIQTWHGSLGIKKIGKDSPCDSINNNIYFSQIDTNMIDYLISNSEFEDNVYKNRFSNKGEICKFGHPRNDIFFKTNDKMKQKLFKELNIAQNTNIILYAPTFRNKTIRQNLDCFDLDYINLLNKYEKLTSQKYVLLVRKHPETEFIKNIDNKKIIDVSRYPDMQELLVCADVLISDYSSCMFDFMLSRKPCFIYATDIEEYNNERGFYYPLETTPFPIATNNEELINNIKNFDYEKYKIKVEEFLKEKGCIEDGHASERVVELIKKIMKGDN